jgi:hypothetical protein
MILKGLILSTLFFEVRVTMDAVCHLQCETLVPSQNANMMASSPFQFSESGMMYIGFPGVYIWLIWLTVSFLAFQIGIDLENQRNALILVYQI